MTGVVLSLKVIPPEPWTKREEAEEKPHVEAGC